MAAGLFLLVKVSQSPRRVDREILEMASCFNATGIWVRVQKAKLRPTPSPLPPGSFSQATATQIPQSLRIDTA